MGSPITGVSIVYPNVCSGVDQRKKSKLRVNSLCEGNSPVKGEFRSQNANNGENLSIWWRHNIYIAYTVHLLLIYWRRLGRRHCSDLVIPEYSGFDIKRLNDVRMAIMGDIEIHLSLMKMMKFDYIPGCYGFMSKPPALHLNCVNAITGWVVLKFGSCIGSDSELVWLTFQCRRSNVKVIASQNAIFSHF